MSVADVVRDSLQAAGLEYEEDGPGVFVAKLPGEQKLFTTVSLVVGPHSLSINAFVARRPDEHHEAVYRWVLERNARMFVVAYSLDHIGDLYLTGRLPLEAVTPDVLDRVYGTVLTHADGDFNHILELGFGSAIRAEWEWRLARGESTRNLEAFRHLAPRD